MLEAICIGIALSSMIIGGVALGMACICWSKVTGMEKSTHQIQYVPVDENGLVGEDLEKNIRKALGEEELEKEFL